MNRSVMAAVAGLAVIAAVGVGVWATQSGEPEVDRVPEARARTATAPPIEAATPPAPRQNGSRIPDSLQDDMRRHRERLERAAALGFTVDGNARTIRRSGLVGSEAPSDAPEPWATDADGIQSAVAEVMGEAVDCVEGYGPEVGDFDGDVMLHFTVGAADEGENVAYPEDLVVEAAGVPAAVVSCVTSVYAQLPFEPSDEPITINYPVTLDFAEDAAAQ